MGRVAEARLVHVTEGGVARRAQHLAREAVPDPLALGGPEPVRVRAMLTRAGFVIDQIGPLLDRLGKVRCRHVADGKGLVQVDLRARRCRRRVVRDHNVGGVRPLEPPQRIRIERCCDRVVVRCPLRRERIVEVEL